MTKTRGKDRDVPGPATPWDEVTPGLWMGGHVWTDPEGESRAVVVGDEFDLVISLFTRPGHGPGPHAGHVVEEMPDAPLTTAQLRTVQRLGPVFRIKPGLRRLARALAAFSSVNDVPQLPLGGAPTASPLSSALRSHAPDTAG